MFGPTAGLTSPHRTFADTRTSLRSFARKDFLPLVSVPTGWSLPVSAVGRRKVPSTVASDTGVRINDVAELTLDVGRGYYGGLVTLAAPLASAPTPALGLHLAPALIAAVSHHAAWSGLPPRSGSRRSSTRPSRQPGRGHRMSGGRRGTHRSSCIPCDISVSRRPPQRTLEPVDE
jgi:hypothetical protein